MPVHLKRRAAEQEQLRHMRQSAAEGKGKTEKGQYSKQMEDSVFSSNGQRLTCCSHPEALIRSWKVFRIGGSMDGAAVSGTIVSGGNTSPYQTRPDQTRPAQCCSIVVLHIGCIGCMGCVGWDGPTDRSRTVRPMSEKSRGPGRSREAKLNFLASPDLGIWVGLQVRAGMRLVWVWLDASSECG
jgi:hypothetical protein